MGNETAVNPVQAGLGYRGLGHFPSVVAAADERAAGDFAKALFSGESP